MNISSSMVVWLDFCTCIRQGELALDITSRVESCDAQNRSDEAAEESLTAQIVLRK